MWLLYKKIKNHIKKSNFIIYNNKSSLKRNYKNYFISIKLFLFKVNKPVFDPPCKFFPIKFSIYNSVKPSILYYI